MKPHLLTATLGSIALVTAASLSAWAWPGGVSELAVAANWSQPVGLTFAADGRMLVWEKAGRVWTVENGVKSAQPLIDIREEVGDWRDHGLLGFALDPDFLINGRVYLLYVVDYHHLKHFGTAQYDPGANQYFHDTIARLTRYTANASDGFHTVDYGSRAVLIGETIDAGIPICHQSHGAGSLVFGEDGTLLVSCGDGASYETVDDGGPISGSSNTALADGILRPKEDVGAFRSQLVDCLNGKILRLDPATGDGISSNPFFAASEPRAPRSRVWALGLRNPFRMTLIPGTGHDNPAAGDPGTLAIGDVGWNDWEELDLCDSPGQNFGWPIYEGMEAQPGYAPTATFDLDAPNPLFGIGGCTQAFFTFQSLLVQDTLATPAWPNPCNGGQQVPATLPRFVHVRPAIDWGHGGGPARAKTYAGVNASFANVGSGSSPVSGPQFGGNSAVACTWLSSASLGTQHQNTLVFGDYVASWLHTLTFDANGDPVSIAQLGDDGDAAGLVAASFDASSDALHFIEYDEQGVAFVKKLVSGNLPPTAVASATPSFGPSPLTVQFDASGSIDPEGQPLTFLWDFGDGSLGAGPTPTHVFDAQEDVTAQASFIGKIFALSPPHPLGGGNWDPEVMRDGDQPPLGSTDDARQYDTFHEGDQGADDWIGYSFATPREFRAMRFQEGKHFWDGGWFDTLGVQVFSGATWSSVGNLTIAPAYAGDDGVHFGLYQLSFDPIVGTAIRLRGDPGGFAGFISVGELRVIATAVGAGQPSQRDVTLTVTDAVGNPATAELIVSLDNTPPSVAITSPVDGSTFAMTQNTTVTLSADVVDAEHGAGELACSWQTILHHDDHSHAEPPDSSCATTSTITPVGCDGHDYSYEFVLTVTDAAGLSTQRSVSMYPDCCGVAPTVYCTAKVNSAGCTPSIASSGIPKASQTSGFVLSCASVLNNKIGLLIYGANGRAHASFAGGTLCVKGPLKRAVPVLAGGNPPPASDCSGVLSLDVSAFAHGLLGGNPIPELLTPGTLIDAQWWQRDPGFAPPANVGLSDGIEFVVCE